MVGKGRRGESGYRCEDEAHTNTTTVQQDVPRDIGPSAIGKKSESTQDSWVMSVSKWFADERRKTQVFRLMRTRSFSASHFRSNLSAMKARS